ncbi:hypothetical protein ACVWWR_001277 [Bradyrhizobium sp. LM3.2]|jgi:hypothetical protein
MLLTSAQLYAVPTAEGGIVLTGHHQRETEHVRVWGRIQANLDVVLEQVCAELPNGGDHASRRYIAEQLIEAARAGKISLGELTSAGRRALVYLKNAPKSA